MQEVASQGNRFTLADELLYTTVNLARLHQNSPIGSGTGFFWNTPTSDGSHVPVIITNKHVVEGADAIIAICHLANADRDGPEGKFANCVISFDVNDLVAHPDPDVDLCALAFGPTILDANRQGHPLFYKAITPQHIPHADQWDNFDSIEEVVMIGCPRGIFDEFNNLPIVRRGITATPLGKRYGGRDEFMVDMACFPGSSGSPIFTMSSSHYDRRTGDFVMENRFYFVGVLYSGQ